MSNKVEARQVLKDPVLFLAFGFGSGLMPRAPGTAGTLAAIPLYLWFSQYSLTVYLLLVFLVSITGVWICRQASARLGVHDHPGIVWDEIAGFLITMIPASGSWLWVAAGFVLFRLFDIWKPWPINLLDKNVHGGLGIMLDDVMAAVYALIVLQLAQDLLI